MKRILIPFIAAFIVSLGVATGVVMFRAPKHVPVVAAKKAVTPDSSKPAMAAVNAPAAVVPDSGTVATAGSSAQTTSPAPKGDAAPAVAQSKGQASAAATGKVEQKTAAAPPPAMTDSMVGQRLGKVFSAMQAKDAARVLEQMDDADVRVILRSLSNKQQAAILGSFPTERAATIMRATLRGVEGEQ